MRRFLLVANVFAFGLVVAACGPIMASGKNPACAALHMGCPTAHATVRFSKMVASTAN